MFSLEKEYTHPLVGRSLTWKKKMTQEFLAGHRLPMYMLQQGGTWECTEQFFGKCVTVFEGRLSESAAVA